jgi:hypothetical protein
MGLQTNDAQVLELRISAMGREPVFTPKALNIVAQGQRR